MGQGQFQAIFRPETAGRVGPLDDHRRMRVVEQLLEAELRIFAPGHAVEVQMMQGQALAAIAVRKRESRARHAAAIADSEGKAASQSRLAHAEFAVEENEIAGLELPAQTLAERDGLLFTGKSQSHKALNARGR